MYEELVYKAEHCDTLGFGPSGINYFTNTSKKQSLKLFNFTKAADYSQAISDTGKGWAHYFSYELHDLKIFYLTRQIAMLRIDISAYKSLFNTNPKDDFPMEFKALQEAGLLNIQKNYIRLSPVGIFYADTVAGLLAWRQVHYYRLKQMRESFSVPTKNIVYDLDINVANNHFMG